MLHNQLYGHELKLYNIVYNICYITRYMCLYDKTPNVV